MIRYGSRRNNRMIGVADHRSGRLQTFVIIGLLLALVIILVISIPAIRQQNEMTDYLYSRMLTECDAALQRVQRLSRNASGTSTTVVAELRSYIYSIDVLNQTQNALTGKQYIDSTRLSRLYSLLEEYAGQLIRGSDTGTLQSNIASELQGLNEELQTANGAS